MKRTRFTEEQIIGVLREHEAGANDLPPLGGPLPGHPGQGYMEIFMHWSVLHRHRDRMADFARGIAAADLARMNVIVEPNRCIALLELVRP